MKPFDYTVPASVDEAVRAGAKADTRFVAGGTTLVDLMKLEVETPAHLVDLNPLGDGDQPLGDSRATCRTAVFASARSRG